MNTIDAAIVISEGQGTPEEQASAMQVLINSGQVWLLEGHMGREAISAIKSGVCTLGPTAHTDYWGNRIPARNEVKPGTPGSPEFVEQCNPEIYEHLVKQGL